RPRARAPATAARTPARRKWAAHWLPAVGRSDEPLRPLAWPVRESAPGQSPSAGGRAGPRRQACAAAAGRRPPSCPCRSPPGPRGPFPRAAAGSPPSELASAPHSQARRSPSPDGRRAPGMRNQGVPRSAPSEPFLQSSCCRSTDGKRKSQNIIKVNLVHSFCSSCHFIIESDRAACREFVWKNGEAVRGNFRGTKDESHEAWEVVKRLSQVLGR